MDRQAEDMRLHVRFPFRTRVSYTVMGDNFHLPGMFPAEAETVDSSECGLGICLEDIAVDAGSMLVLRIRVSGFLTTVPVLAKVRWVTENEHGVCRAGLEFLP